MQHLCILIFSSPFYRFFQTHTQEFDTKIYQIVKQAFCCAVVGINIVGSSFCTEHGKYPFFQSYTKNVWTRNGFQVLYFHISMGDVSQYSRHKPAGPDISSPRDKTSKIVGTEAPWRVCHMLYRNLCIMQMGQLRDFMTCAKSPISAVCMDRGVLSFRAVITGKISCQYVVYVVHLMCVFVGWLRRFFESFILTK